MQTNRSPERRRGKGTQTRSSLSLPASHHHLNVLALLLFLLRRRIRLGRHDGRAKTCGPGGDSDTVGTGRPPPIALCCRSQVDTCSSATPRSTQASGRGHRPATTGETEPRLVSAQKPATIRRLNLKKDTSSPANSSAAREASWDACRHRAHAGAWPGEKGNGVGWVVVDGSMLCELTVLLLLLLLLAGSGTWDAAFRGLALSVEVTTTRPLTLQMAAGETGLFLRRSGLPELRFCFHGVLNAV